MTDLRTVLTNCLSICKEDPLETDGREDNPAPLSSYEAAGILRDLFADRIEDREGHRFITNEGIDYPF